MEKVHAKIDDFHIDLMKRQAYGMPHMHYHECYEVFIILDGSVDMVIQDKLYQSTSGDVMLIPAEHFHRTVCNRKVTRYIINFSYKYMRKFFSHKAVMDMFRCFDLYLIHLDDETLMKVSKLCNEILNAESEGIKMLRLGEVLYTMCENMDYGLKVKKITPTMEIASNVLGYINDNYKILTEISDIANEFYISKEHLCRVFKKYTGLTVISYINNCKLKSAQCMLTETDKSISEISDECGFSSPSYFSKVFKKTYQLSPADYRKINL